MEEPKEQGQCEDGLSANPLPVKPDITPPPNEQAPLTAPPVAPGSTPTNQKGVLRRFERTLERKHSSGDLQSRLKTRKILGVGETDNGDIHRSKISQVLGHNEHLFMRMPKGYWAWHIFLMTFLIGQGLLVFFFPKKASDFGFLGPDNSTDPEEVITENPVSRRYYTASTMGMAFILKKFLYLNDKTVIRVVQYAMGLFFFSQILLDAYQIFENGITNLFGTNMVILMIFIRIGLCTGCIIFWRRIGAANSGLRKSPSYKDLDDGISK